MNGGGDEGLTAMQRMYVIFFTPLGAMSKAYSYIAMV